LFVDPNTVLPFLGSCENINKSIRNEWFKTKKQTSIKSKSGYNNSKYAFALGRTNYSKDTRKKYQLPTINIVHWAGRVKMDMIAINKHNCKLEHRNAKLTIFKPLPPMCIRRSKLYRARWSSVYRKVSYFLALVFFLHTPEQIEVLCFVMLIALLVWNLMPHECEKFDRFITLESNMKYVMNVGFNIKPFGINEGERFIEFRWLVSFSINLCYR